MPFMQSRKQTQRKADMDIAVIGGGASGLMAAIAAKNRDTRVTIYERGARVGRKILATGNGRCNMTNMMANEGNYYGKEPSFTRGAIRRFWVRETLDLFSELGVLWKEERDGKVYPYSDTASSVLDVLRRRVDMLGIITQCSCDVKAVRKNGNRFVITFYGGRTENADRVILATGGRAAPSLGSAGGGYPILESFGHRITELAPSLVQIKTDADMVRPLKGIKLNARLTIGGKSETGEVLFTDYGLSGPPVFSLSAVLGRNSYAELDIMPEYSFEDVLTMLKARCAYLINIELAEYFTGMLNKRVGQAVLKAAGAAPLSRIASELTERELKRIASVIKAWRFDIRGTMSWNNAQVTKGGAVTAQFDPSTMQSRLVKGLFACGELLDIDGDCGGYNLQWAWSSGYLAGAAAGSVKHEGR